MKSATKRSIVVMLALCIVALPTRAWAGCGVTDVGACVDDAQYNFWYGIAALLWTSVDAPLLQAAYLIDVFRNWLVTTAFTSGYQLLTQLVDPLLVPFAVIALIGSYIAFAMMPLFGNVKLMNLRHVMTWVIMAPLLFFSSGQMIATVETFRAELGNAIFTEVSAIAPGALFGVAADDMAAPKALYGGNPCGTGALTRPGDSLASGMHMDDLAAAMLWANAQDIHCPQKEGDGQDIPDAFYLDAPDGPKYAVAETVGEMSWGSDRQTAVKNMQRGVNRLAMGILPCVLAVVESLIQLLFALALIILWVGLPFALAFVFFEDSSASVVALFRQGFAVLKTSWVSSFAMATVFAALKASAEEGNATAYTAVTFLGLLVVGFLALVGFQTVVGSIQALNSAFFASTNVDVKATVASVGQAAVGTAGMALGAASGGAALAATAAAGYAQTGSGRYAAAAAAGRFTPVAQVGEVAAAMGWVGEETSAGLYAGQRSTHSMHTMRMQMQHDARRTNADGLTIREGVQERRVGRQLGAATRDNWRDTNERAHAVAGSLAANVGGAYTYARSGQVSDDLRARRDQVFEAVGDRWQRLKDAPGILSDDVRQRMDAAPIRSAATDPLLAHAAILAAAHDRFAPDQRYQAYRLDDTGKLRREQPRTDDELAAAMTLPNKQVNTTRLVRHGYTVQQNADQTVSFWKTGTPGVALEQERARLLSIKAISNDGARLLQQQPATPTTTTKPAAEQSSGGTATQAQAPVQIVLPELPSRSTPAKATQSGTPAPTAPAPTKEHTHAS